MQFTFTNAAVGRLSDQLAGSSRSLRLLYDTEGCGCVVNGVPALQLVENPEESDRLGIGEPFQVWYQPQYEVFFEPKLRIDYDLARVANER